MMVGYIHLLAPRYLGRFVVCPRRMIGPLRRDSEALSSCDGSNLRTLQTWNPHTRRLPHFRSCEPRSASVPTPSSSPTSFPSWLSSGNIVTSARMSPKAHFPFHGRIFRVAGDRSHERCWKQLKQLKQRCLAFAPQTHLARCHVGRSDPLFASSPAQLNPAEPASLDADGSYGDRLFAHRYMQVNKGNCCFTK